MTMRREPVGIYPPSAAAAVLGLVLDVKRDFGASGSSESTTGSITAGSSVLTLASPIDFQNGQGISVAGAGTSGALLVTSIASGAGTTTLTLAESAATTVSNAQILHDDSAAINAALSALSLTTGGTIYFPDGVYYCNGPATTTNGYNTILALPYNPFSSVTAGPNPVTIALIGQTFPAEQPSEFSPDAPTNSGSIIICTLATGTSYQSILGGPNQTGIATNKSVITVVTRNLVVRQMYPAPFYAIDLSGCENADLDGVICDVTTPPGSAPAPSSTANGAGILMPNSQTSSMYGRSSLTRFYMQSLGVGIMASAHAFIDNGVIQNCYTGISIIKGEHPIYIGKVNVERNTYDISADSQGGLSDTPRLYVAQLDIEPNSGTSPGPRINDPNNLLQGIVNFVLVYNNAGLSGPLPMNGGANLRVTNLGDVGARSITPPASPLTSGTVYQNTLGITITIYQPAYASTSGTAGTVAVALGPTSTPPTIFTKQIPGTSSSTAPDMVEVRVPPGWYYSMTATSATLATAMFIGE